MTASCVWAPNSIDWAVAALAVSYAGGVLVPANTRFTGHEVLDLVTGPRPLVVVADGFLGRNQVADLRAADVDLGCLGAAGSSTSPAWTGYEPARRRLPDDGRGRGAGRTRSPPTTWPTSSSPPGTTGRSKGAMSAHRQTLGVADAWGELGGVTAEDRYLVVNPFFHSFGYKAGIVVGLLTGATLVPRRRSSTSTRRCG